MSNARLRRSGTALLGVVACTTLAPASAAEPGVPVPTAKKVVETTKVIPGRTIRPVQKALPVDRYELTGRFADESGLWAHAHTGLDFAAPYGAAVKSIASGVVVSVGYDGAYGDKTVVELPDGTKLWYCHQSSVEVNVGDEVDAGQVIGRIGTSGNVTGPHLHLEVRRHGGPVDPGITLRRWGLRP